MSQLFHTYLTFDGNTREAMKFYAECLGADLQMMTFGDADVPCAPAEKNNIMHASLMRGGNVLLMASDTSNEMPVKFVKGNNFSISINCTSIPETEKLFSSLSLNGKVYMPLGETFWATRFAAFEDQFGVNWMLNLSKEHKK